MDLQSFVGILMAEGYIADVYQPEMKIMERKSTYR